MITSSPDDFIQNWLIDEFRSMISGLNDFYQNTDFYLKSIRPTKEEKYLKVYNVDAFSNYSSNITEEEIVKRTLTDVHSLGKWRVNGALPHINAWYDAFGVTPESPMYIAPEKRASIW